MPFSGTVQLTRPKKTCKLSWESGGPRTIAKQQLVKGKEKLFFDIFKDGFIITTLQVENGYR